MIQSRRLVVVLLALSAGVSSCSRSEQAPNASATPNPATDEASVRAHVAGFEAAINKRDFAAFAAQFAPDGDVIIGDRPISSGPDAIRRTFETGWASAPPARQASITVDRIRFLGADIAVLDASARFSEGDPKQDRATMVVVRRNGAWKTSVARIYLAAKQ